MEHYRHFNLKWWHPVKWTGQASEMSHTSVNQKTSSMIRMKENISSNTHKPGERVLNYTQFTSVLYRHFDPSVSGSAPRRARTTLMHAFPRDQIALTLFVPSFTGWSEVHVDGSSLHKLSAGWVWAQRPPGRAALLTLILITVGLINATLCWFVAYTLAVFHCVWPDSAVRLWLQPAGDNKAGLNVVTGYNAG